MRSQQKICIGHYVRKGGKMTYKNAIIDYIIPALKRTWNDKICEEVMTVIDEDGYNFFNLKSLEIKLSDIILHQPPKDGKYNVSLSLKEIDILIDCIHDSITCEDCIYDDNCKHN